MAINEKTKDLLIAKLRAASDLHHEIADLFAEVPEIPHTEDQAADTQIQAEAHKNQAYFCFADAEGLANPA